MRSDKYLAFGIFYLNIILSTIWKQTSDSKNSTNLVVVSSPDKVVFSNCIFQRQYTAVGDLTVTTEYCFVLIESGAEAVFSNCIFQSNYPTGAMNSTGYAIQNLNALATTVYVGTGANYSTHNHRNVTSLGAEIS